MINNNLNGKVMKNIKKFVLLALSLCITLFATSCSEDETSQASINSLNMLDENHGKTLLGETLSEKLSALSKRFLERYSPTEPIAMFHSE